MCPASFHTTIRVYSLKSLVFQRHYLKEVVREAVQSGNEYFQSKVVLDNDVRDAIKWGSEHTMEEVSLAGVHTHAACYFNLNPPSKAHTYIGICFRSSTEQILFSVCGHNRTFVWLEHSSA